MIKFCINNCDFFCFSIFQNHKSVFIKDDSKVFNLAELVCNEIKLIIIQGHITNRDQTQFLLDQLTKIMEVCEIKSKNVDPSFKIKLKGSDEKKPQNEMKENNVVCKKIIKPAAPQKCKYPRRIKQTPSNHTRVIKSNPRRKNPTTT